MTRFTTLAALAAGACIATASPALAQTQQQEARFAQAQTRFNAELQTFRTEFDRYQQARTNNRGQRGNDPRYDNRYPDTRGAYNDERDEGDYDAARYYRQGSGYQERVLSSDERVYAGQDGRYYCKRSDGTTGLIIGAAGGGVLGNVIDGGRSRTVGTLLGAALGAFAGRAVEQNQQQVRCR